MANSLDLLEKKYGDPALYLPDPAAGQPAGPQPAAPRSTLCSWRDSEAVCMLRAFLREYGDRAGISLRTTRQGRAVLLFRPGLTLRDRGSDRFDLAEHAADLLDRAREDLDHLIFYGLINPKPNSWR